MVNITTKVTDLIKNRPYIMEYGQMLCRDKPQTARARIRSSRSQPRCKNT